MWSRRDFLKTIFVTGGLLTTSLKVSGSQTQRKESQNSLETIYRAVNGTPADNLTKVIELMGRIEKIIGSDDVVLIKPNVRWWNQGAPNLMALKTFVDLIVERPGGFKGEVVLFENCHQGPSPWTSIGSGWAHEFERNSDIPKINHVNDLCKILKNKYGVKFSVCHLIDVGAGNKRVFGPSNGNGYVYCDGSNRVPLILCENGVSGSNYRSTIMTYPILKTDKGTIIDFKHGIWEKGSYTGQPLRFINFPALNYNSTFCGMTSAIKNYMGITDLSGGPDPNDGGRLTKNYYNFHSFPFNKWSPGPSPGMLGAEIGIFMKTIRKADLNITTAEWVGLASRSEAPVVHTKAILASTDPVALDYHAAKYILFPNSNLAIHNPDNRKGPLYPYLVKCAESSGSVLDETKVEVKSYDFKSKTFHGDDDLSISAPIQWGTNLKAILKYLVLRYWKT
jgi:hypothetical protein